MTDKKFRHLVGGDDGEGPPSVAEEREYRERLVAEAKLLVEREIKIKTEQMFGALDTITDPEQRTEAERRLENITYEHTDRVADIVTGAAESAGELERNAQVQASIDALQEGISIDYEKARSAVYAARHIATNLANQELLRGPRAHVVAQYLVQTSAQNIEGTMAENREMLEAALAEHFIEGFRPTVLAAIDRAIAQTTTYINGVEEQNADTLVTLHAGALRQNLVQAIGSVAKQHPTQFTGDAQQAIIDAAHEYGAKDAALDSALSYFEGTSRPHLPDGPVR